MEIVGHCPKCGAPVYGVKELYLDDKPQITYSCECRGDDSLSFESVVRRVKEYDNAG